MMAAALSPEGMWGMRQGGSIGGLSIGWDAKKAKGGRRSEWVGIGCLNLGRKERRE